jgi:enoyl-CoA hydratase/carnithine racemase
VITGAGDTFCAGQDFSEMSAESGAEHGFPRFMQALIDCDRPVIAAVNGVGIGLGLTMLLHTDINYIAEGARLRVPFVTLGVVPEAASSWLLPTVIGFQRAAEVLFTARWIEASETVDMGLTLAVVPAVRLLDTALAKASEIAANPPAAVQHTKRLLRVWRRQAITAARQREDEAFQERLGTPENLEAIRAFFEKRAPTSTKCRPGRTKSNLVGARLRCSRRGRPRVVDHQKVGDWNHLAAPGQSGFITARDSFQVRECDLAVRARPKPSCCHETSSQRQVGALERKGTCEKGPTRSRPNQTPAPRRPYP